MKAILIMACLLAQVLSCASRERVPPEVRYGPPVAQVLDLFVSVDAETDSMGVKHWVMTTQLENKTDQTLTIDEPTYLWLNITPIMLDSNHDTLSQGIRVNYHFPVPTVELLPRETFKSRLPYFLDECFQLRRGEAYTLRVEYKGGVLLEDGSYATYDSRLLSNVVEIRP